MPIPGSRLPYIRCSTALPLAAYPAARTQTPKPAPALGFGARRTWQHHIYRESQEDLTEKYLQQWLGEWQQQEPMQLAPPETASTTSPVLAPPEVKAIGLAGRPGQLGQEQRSIRQTSCGASPTKAAESTPAASGTTATQEALLTSDAGVLLAPAEVRPKPQQHRKRASSSPAAFQQSAATTSPHVSPLATGRQRPVPLSPSGQLCISQPEAVVPVRRAVRDRQGVKRRSRHSAAAAAALAGEAGLPASDRRSGRQCHGRTSTTSASVALAAAMAGVEVGAVELAQERVRLAERRGSAKHAGTSNAMVASADVANSPLQVDAAQPEVAPSETMLQQRPAVSDWTQPHALERRPKVQRRLQQAASLRQDSLPSAAIAMPHRQTSTDVALQRHRSGASGTLDSYPALAALASFLDKGSEPGDLSCWEHIQQHKHLERQRAALRESPQHVVPDAQLAAHLEMDQPVLTAQLRLGEMAQQCLMERHKGLVHAALQRFRMQKRVAIDDLMLAGLRGLEIGIDKWDPERGCLTTVACWYIRDHISKTYGRLQTAICVPATTLEQLSKLHRVKQAFSHRHSREPTEVQLLRLTGFHPQTLSRLQSAAALWEVDLDASPEDGSASFVETLSAQSEGNATEYGAQAEAKRELARAVAALPLEQASAIQMVYGLNQHGPMRAKEIGRRLGISAYRLNKVLEEAMLTLRSNHDLRQLVGAF